MTQRNRLDGALPREFSTPRIDRDRPISFFVDGLKVTGFEGDTVLSALIASKVERVGRRGGERIVLDEASAPPVALAGGEGRPDLAMPMALCPAMDGARFVTIGPRLVVAPVTRRLRKWFGRPASLGHDFNGARPVDPWLDLPPKRRLSADVVIVGAGVAGLSAALEAARRKARVLVVEREAEPGGLSVFFGRAEGEPDPASLIADLLAQAKRRSEITFLTATQAFELSGTTVRTVRVTFIEGRPVPERVDIDGRRVVLATGAMERLPVFAGNRLPGVRLSSWAWRLAAHYNVWPGDSAHVHTGSNVGYRMAMLGSDSGKEIRRVTDPRSTPRTRFIDFCKAFGFRLGWGALIDRASFASGKRPSLTIHHRDAGKGRVMEETVMAESLIVSGGWQPDIGLWMLGGGHVRWDVTQGLLRAIGTLDAVDLAGAAAGYVTVSGCVQSGAAAVARGLAGEGVEVVETLIDETFEAPQSSLPVSVPVERGLASAYLAPASGLVLPEPGEKGLRGLFVRKAEHDVSPDAALSQGEVIGLLASGMLDPEAAAAFCAERVIAPRQLSLAPPSGRRVDESGAIPDYLEGRFGAGQARWLLAPGIGRRFEAGSLVFGNTDETNPLKAIGVVLGPNTSNRTEILLGAHKLGAGEAVFVREGRTATEIRPWERAETP